MKYEMPHDAPQGWEYAVDFPANFSPDKKWNSCVRRRRWIRYRRYIAQGTWAKVWTLSPYTLCLFKLSTGQTKESSHCLPADPPGQSQEAPTAAL